MGTLKKDIAETERMLKALIKFLEKNHESLDPLLQPVLRSRLLRRVDYIGEETIR